MDIDSVAEASVVELVPDTTYDIMKLLESFITVTNPWPFTVWPVVSPESSSAASGRASQASFQGMVGQAVVTLAHFSVTGFLARWDRRLMRVSYSGPPIHPAGHVYRCRVVYLAYLLEQDCVSFQ